MNKPLERLLYSLGFNISAYDVSEELAILAKGLPESFRGRDIVDIGCGDGKVSARLSKVLGGRSYIGYDQSATLVRRAKARGVAASVLDAEKEETKGDVAILWGVLHHFEKPAESLGRLRQNYNHLIIRECVSPNRLLELGHAWDRAHLLGVLRGGGIDISHCLVLESPKTQAVIIFAPGREQVQ